MDAQSVPGRSPDGAGVGVGGGGGGGGGTFSHGAGGQHIAGTASSRDTLAGVLASLERRSAPEDEYAELGVDGMRHGRVHSLVYSLHSTRCEALPWCARVLTLKTSRDHEFTRDKKESNPVQALIVGWVDQE